jgi:hypothetical protein
VRIILAVMAGAAIGIVGGLCWLAWYLKDMFR